MRAGLLALGVLMPALLVQDVLRYVAFALRRPGVSLAMDAVWIACQAIAYIVLRINVEEPGVGALTMVWGGGALLSLSVGLFYIASRYGTSGVRLWRKEHSRLGGQFLTEFFIGSGVQQVVALALPFAAGLAAAGSYRGAQVMVAPISVVMTSLVVTVMPTLGRRFGLGDIGGVVRLCRQVSFIGGTLSALAAIFLLLVPDAFGQFFLGDTWSSGGDIAPIIAIQIGLISVSQGAMWGLRAIRRVDASIRLRLAVAPITLALGIGGACMHGAAGAAIGLVIAMCLSSACWWTLLIRLTRHARLLGLSSPPSPLQVSSD
jgi:O-antigen/teichoic acid export membrane protein